MKVWNLVFSRRLLPFLAMLLFSMISINKSSYSQTTMATVNDLAWTSDGILLAVGRNDGTIEVVNTLEQQSSFTVTVSPYQVISLAWSPTDSDQLAVFPFLGPMLLLDFRGRQFISFEFQTDQNFVRKVLWSPDGEYLASLGQLGEGASAISEAKIWNPRNRDLFAAYEDGYSLTDMAWNPQSSELLLLTGVANYYGSEIVLWDIERNAVKWTVHEPDYGVTHIAWSPDGDMFATMTEGVTDETYGTAPVRVHDAVTGSAVATLSAGMSYRGPIAWSPSSYLAVCDGYNIQIWDTVTEQMIETIQSDEFVSAMVWSPDDSRLAYGSGNTVEIVQVEGYS